MVNRKVAKLLDRVLGQGSEKNKSNYAYHCPFCHHRKRKLEVNLESESDSFQWWHCWVCGKAGFTLSSLLQKMNISYDYVKILRELVGENKKSFHKKKETVFDKPEKEIVINYLPKEFKPLYIKSRQPEYRRALKYVFDRGLSAYDLLRYNIGYCESGRYAGRVIIPSYDEEGNLNFFVGRTFMKHDAPHMTPPWERNIIGFELFINWKEPLVLTEGVFDAITIGRNAIPLFGKFLSKRLRRRIFEEGVKEVIIALDLDARREIIKLSEYLMNQGIKVYVLNMKDKDPNKIGRREMLDLIYSAKQMTSSEILKIKIMERL